MKTINFKSNPLTALRLFISVSTTLLFILSIISLILFLLPNHTEYEASIINNIFGIPILSNLFLATISLLELVESSKLMNLLFGLIIILSSCEYIFSSIPIAPTTLNKQLLLQLTLNICLWFCFIIFIPAITYLGYLNQVFLQQSVTIQHPKYLEKIECILVEISQPELAASIAFSKMLHDINTNTDYISSLDHLSILPYTQTLNSLIHTKNRIFNKSEHYLRNVLNRAPATLDELLTHDIDDWILMDPISMAYHMYGPNGEYNLKFVSKDGHFEAVYNKDGLLLTQENNPTNMATYNYASPYTEKSLHQLFDVDPYKTWGNTPIDSPKNFAETSLNVAKFYQNTEARSRYDLIKNQFKKN